jgi:hypothetical protein
MHPIALGIGVAAGLAVILFLGREKRVYGSPTNASDAVDDIELPPHPSPDDVLDAAVKETFPASDPIAVQETYWRSSR